MSLGAADEVAISSMSDADISTFLKEHLLTLSVDECKKVVELLGRDPTLTEVHIFNIQWSEHCSYKSSKQWLKMLPTSGPTVMLGVGEDAGIVRFAQDGEDVYGIAMSHESHNHPSQVVPYEGAATGVGGNIRDVLCMGARVIACADPLRFGDPNGKEKNRVKYIANQVVDGIAGYGNPLGVPVLAGDVYFNSSFDDNCLVNVVTLGVIKEKDIIHSAAPPNSEGHDIIVVGKATDASGFGGAAFASVVLDDEQEEYNKGAVQVPDPFLKNILVRASESVFAAARKKKVTLGFKDMGAGGIMCATSELCESGGVGADIDLEKVHVAVEGLEPYVIACAETQERFAWICPPKFTSTILRIYNEEFELPRVAAGARASVVGKVTTGDYVLQYKGKPICKAPASVVTKGIEYTRVGGSYITTFREPTLKEPTDYGSMGLKILRHPNVASKASIYKHYDTEVQGLAVVRPGEADAGVQAPVPGKYWGVALSVDHNPRYSRISPFHGAVNGVAEAMRNVACVGATPIGMTDCLNMGNPETSEHFRDFIESVEGLSVASHKLWLKDYPEKPVPFVAGNVSFYNQSAAGNTIDPSPIIGCVGKIDDYRKVVRTQLVAAGSNLLMIGERKDELGGSVYYDVHNELGKHVPELDLEVQRREMHAVIDLIDAGLVKSCHDISDGGLFVTVAEMILGKDADGKIGVDVTLGASELAVSRLLFSETPGYVLEVDFSNMKEIEKILGEHQVASTVLGTTTNDAEFLIKEVLEVSVASMAEAWTSGVVEAMK
ncbi:MAG: phosphoribosylformylglycinamidine synthase subunit PurL [Nanoarchaeota archaeon]|nr:phosphoribosylformylglycinamidine synthase subunit PurL [Nanoarchaeota archaeon]